VPNTKSAEKRVRITAKRTLRNKRVKSMVKTAIRRFEEALNTDDKDGALQRLKNAQAVIDKAVTKGVWHKNKAARKKSRLVKQFKKIAG